jgi:hypothetical protein
MEAEREESQPEHLAMASRQTLPCAPHEEDWKVPLQTANKEAVFQKTELNITRSVLRYSLITIQHQNKDIHTIETSDA